MLEPLEGDVIKYKYEGDFKKLTVQKLKTFVAKYKAGELKKFLRSAGAPKDNSGPVKIIVGKTFDKIVLDPTKEVLVMYWMPKCEECKLLLTELKKLGEEV